MIGRTGNKVAAALGAAIACVTSIFGQAHAAIGSDQVNATGACNGALPAFETTLRKRPLAIANEGGTTAFVSCSLQTSGVSNLGYFEAVLGLTNRGNATASVACTLVGGGSPPIAFGYDHYPQTVNIAPGASAEIVWIAESLGVDSFGVLVNFSCALPPGVEIGSMGGAYDSV